MKKPNIPTWLIVILLFIIPIVGLILMWVQTPRSTFFRGTFVRVVISCLFGIVAVIQITNVIKGCTREDSQPDLSAPISTTESSTKQTSLKVVPEPKPEPEPEPEPELSEAEQVVIYLRNKYGLPVECAISITEKAFAQDPWQLPYLPQALKRYSSCPKFHDAKEISKIYNNNEVRGDDIYKGKRVLVKGVADKVSKGAFGNVYIPLKIGRWSFNSVHLEPNDESDERVREVNKGDKIYASCIGSTMIMGSPMFQDCVFF